jgi:hypothetical protein
MMISPDNKPYNVTIPLNIRAHLNISFQMYSRIRCDSAIGMHAFYLPNTRDMSIFLTNVSCYIEICRNNSLLQAKPIVTEFDEINRMRWIRLRQTVFRESELVANRWDDKNDEHYFLDSAKARPAVL